MELKDKIAEILKEREARRASLEKRRDALETLKSSLENLRYSLDNGLAAVQDEYTRKRYTALFRKIDDEKIAEAASDISDLIVKMENGLDRFSRKEISFATVGQERQGKSQFLQSISQLDNRVIPAYNATSCTGAVSIIHNVSDMKPGEVYAEIRFRDPKELVDIVNEYIGQIDPGLRISRFNEIGRINKERIAAKVHAGNETHGAAYQNLLTILEHFDEIRPLFGSERFTTTDPEVIRRYVAQNNGKGEGQAGAEEYFNYLAVKYADIRCRFQEDLGLVRLVDTIGIGAVKTGIVEQMLETVDKECEAAIVVTKPISGVQERDQALYKALRENFQHRDTSKWVFYLVNHHKGQNDNTVQAFANNVRKNRYAVAGCYIVDASDQEAVVRDFMLPMLQTLLENMTAIDDKYEEEEINKPERALQKKLQAVLEGFPDETRRPGDTAGNQAYIEGTKFFPAMTAELRDTVRRWERRKDSPDDTILWKNVKPVLDHLEDVAPSEEKINAILQSHGGLVPSALWTHMLHYVRNEITDRFIAIDDALKSDIRSFKNSLVKPLYQKLRKLGQDAMQEESLELEDAESADPDMAAWLGRVMARLGDDPQYSQIQKAFQFLSEFEFNTRVQIIQEVRRHMYIINPILKVYAAPECAFTYDNCGAEIHFYLTSRLALIEDELRHSFSNLYTSSSKAFYAAAEEFYDRLTFAVDLKGDRIISMEQVWGALFAEYSKLLTRPSPDSTEAVKQLMKVYSGARSQLSDYVAARK